MDIIEEKKYYTVLNKEGIAINCGQDKNFANAKAEEIGGKVLITDYHPFLAEPPYLGSPHYKNKFLAVLGIYVCTISALLLPTTLIALIFNLENWTYYLFAFLFFSVTTYLGMKLAHINTYKYL